MVTISVHKYRYVLEEKLWLPVPRSEVFPFFADPFNLEEIMPPWLHLRLVTPEPVTMSEGLRLDYRVRLGPLPLRWQGEITTWEPPHRFVDKQRHGPCRYWRHEHSFTDDKHGTLIYDRVEYTVHGGSLVHALMVKPQLTRIFTYRTEMIQRIFLDQEARTFAAV